MRIAALQTLLALCAATPASATIWGLNCTPNSSYCPSPGQLVTVAGALNAQIVRVRVSLPHPFCVGTTWPTTGWAGCSIATMDVDPVAGRGNVITLADASAFLVPTPPYAVSSDVLPAGTMVTFVTGSTITLDHSVLQYVPASTNYDVMRRTAPHIGAYASLSGANIPIDLTIFAAASPGGAADAAEIGDTPYSPVTGNRYSPSSSYTNDLHYLIDVQISGSPSPLNLPAIITVGNEEDGGGTATCGMTVTGLPLPVGYSCSTTPTYNGDAGYDGTGTPTWYIHKLRDTVAVAHGYAQPIPVGDSGSTLHGVELAYWNYLFTACTTPSVDACRKAADAFKQLGLGKNSTVGAASSLPTWCAPGTPPYLSTSGQALVDRVMAIWTADAANSVDYANIHYYDDPWIGLVGAMQWAKSQAGGIKLMANEIGSYHGTVVNTVAIMAGAQQLGFVYADWWNQQGNSGTTYALALTDPVVGSTVPIRNSGAAWLAYRGYPATVTATGQTLLFPNVMTGPAPVAPLCVGE